MRSGELCARPMDNNRKGYEGVETARGGGNREGEVGS